MGSSPCKECTNRKMLRYEPRNIHSFIDFERAFDMGQHDHLRKMFSNKYIDKRGIPILRNLYWNQTANLKVEDELAEARG